MKDIFLELMELIFLELHDLSKDLPYLPERVNFEKVEKTYSQLT